MQLMTLDNDALHAACLDVARAIRWKDNPVDEMPAKAAIEPIFDVAIPPIEDDVEAFASTLDILIKLACPKTGINQDQDQFFKDIEEGIQEARRDHASPFDPPDAAR